MRGRVPKPVEQRRREGATRGLAEPRMVTGRAELAEVIPPAKLSRDARAWWDAVVPELARCGLLERTDAHALWVAATCWANVVKATRRVAREGLLARGSTGQVCAHPAMRVQHDAMSMFERYMSHFAGTPTSRARLGLQRLHGAALLREMNELIGDGDDAPIAVDAEVDADDLDVGVPGLPGG